MPLIIIAAAGVLWLWGTQREHQQSQEIQHAIREMCRYIHRTRENDPTEVGRQLGVSTDLLPGLVERVREVVPDEPLAMERIAVDVHIGDARPPYGDGGATHHVIIRAANRALGLRMVHTGAPSEPQVIGYWVLPRFTTLNTSTQNSNANLAEWTIPPARSSESLRLRRGLPTWRGAV